MKNNQQLIPTLERIRDGISGKWSDERAVGSKTGRHNPVVSLSRGGIPVGKEYEKKVAKGGWGWIFSPEAWKKHPVATGALFLNIFHGICMEVAKKSAQRAAHILSGQNNQETVVALVEAISADRNKHACLTARIPESGGGFKRAIVSCGKVDNIREFCELLGRGVEIRATEREVSARRIPGESIVERGTGLSRLSVYEIASVAEAMSKGHTFSGEWRRTPIPVPDGVKTLSADVAGLYVHGRTKQGILVFRGTRPLSVRDWTTDIALTHGILGEQYSKVADTVRAAEKVTTGIMVAGHSKGGGMAQYAALLTGVRAVTFNSVGLPETIAEGGKKARVSHYITRYDWVGNMGGGKGGEGGGIAGPLAQARGLKQRLLGEKSDIHILRSTRNRYKFLDIHSLDMVKQGLTLDPKFIRQPFERPSAGANMDKVGGIRIGALAGRALERGDVEGAKKSKENPSL